MNTAIQSIHSTLTGVFELVIPEIVLIATALILFMLGTFRAGSKVSGILALAGLGGALFSQSMALPQATNELTVSPIIADELAFFIRTLAVCGGILLVFLCWEESPRHTPEYLACILIIIAGLALVGLANELTILFLAFELISIPTYLMLYLARPDTEAQEATLKYFMLSILSSALMLFGFSYLYGITGSMNIPAILQILPLVGPTPMGNLEIVAAIMILAGIGFKITAVPFHFYAPDVYQGGPTGTVAMLAFVPKVAGFVALMRIFGGVGMIPAGVDGKVVFSDEVPLVLFMLALLTMTTGNVLALWQTNVRRLLAYSSVAHAGYMLIGVAVLTSRPDLLGDSLSAKTAQAVSGPSGILFYLVAYGAMTLGAFAVLAYLGTAEKPIETLEDFAGLAKTHPLLAAHMILFLLSMIGLPLTAGFIGKFLVFASAIAAPDSAMQYYLQLLVLFGAINAAIGAYYYLQWIGVMVLREGIREIKVIHSVPIYSVILACGFLTLLLGIYPKLLMQSIQVALSGQ